MRIILILLVIVAVVVVVQNQRNHCKWGESGWANCILGRAPAADTTPATSEPAPQPK
jgi:hypothetical protein